MGNCYHPEVKFYDPVFEDLQGKEVTMMWKMLVERSKGNLTINFNNVVGDDKSGSASWEALYAFSKTGRMVHNKIEASFEFADGRILKHTDTFSLWRWSSMALGMTGILLGFTPLVKNKIRRQSQQLLKKYIDEHSNGF